MELSKRSLGDSGLQVSEVSLGTVKFGRTQGLKYPSTPMIPDDTQLIELLNTAKSLGMNLLDTAPAYGESEKRIGELLGKDIDQWVVSTKVGEEFDGKRSLFNFTPEAIEKSIYRSLKRLNRDYLDIVLIHSNGQDREILLEFGALDVLQNLKERGVIIATGISHKTIEGARIAISKKADVLMATFNEQNTTEKDVIEEAHKSNIGVLVKKPLASGNNLNSSHLKFVLTNQAISSAVIGTTNIEHLKMNAKNAQQF